MNTVHEVDAIKILYVELLQLIGSEIVFRNIFFVKKEDFISLSRVYIWCLSPQAITPDPAGSSPT